MIFNINSTRGHTGSLLVIIKTTMIMMIRIIIITCRAGRRCRWSISCPRCSWWTTHWVDTRGRAFRLAASWPNTIRLFHRIGGAACCLVRAPLYRWRWWRSRAWNPGRTRAVSLLRLHAIRASIYDWATALGRLKWDVHFGSWTPNERLHNSPPMRHRLCMHIQPCIPKTNPIIFRSHIIAPSSQYSETL